MSHLQLDSPYSFGQFPPSYSNDCHGDNGIASAVCNDGRVCTDDACFDGECVHTVLDGMICKEDGDPCTMHRCNSVGVCAKINLTGPNCQFDNNPCTDDKCQNGLCVAVANSKPCVDDGDPCTDDICRNKKCEHDPKTGGECTDDGLACTEDTCVEGECVHPERDCEAELGQSDPCSKTPYCIEEVGCFKPSRCDDFDPCTWDVCELNTGDCEHEPVNPSPPQSPHCSDLGCNVIYPVPDWIPVNNDDDNANGVPDFAEFAPVAGENDLKQINLSAVSCPPSACGNDSDWHLCHGSSNQFWTPWLGALKGDNVGHDDPWFFPVATPIWLEGLTPTSACGEPVFFWANYGQCCWHRGIHDVPVVRVETLTWMVANIHLGNPPLSQCPTNGGQRIFPDMNNPEDEHVGAKAEVRLRARVEPPVRNLTVYFRVFDVDDPFDQVHGPEGRNDVQYATEVDNDRVGNDNRPDSLGVGNYTAITNEFGFASITVPITKQPGNNYRAAASLIIGNGLTQVTQQQADDLSAATDSNGKFVINGGFTGYQCPVVWSPMLTVWRRLHVEFDSMEAESETIEGRTPDWQVGTVQSTLAGVKGTILRLGGGGFSLRNRQFEGGQVECFAGGYIYQIWDNVGNDVELSVILTPLQIQQLLGKACVVKDDDPSNGLLPHPYSIGPLIRSAYNDAYIDIRPVPSAYNTNTKVSYSVYLIPDQIRNNDIWGPSHDVYSIPAYWSSRVITSYQFTEVNLIGEPTYSRDGDGDLLTNNSNYPNGPYWLHTEFDPEVQEGITITSMDWNSFVFRAAVRDLQLPGTPATSDLEYRTIAHEIGHSAGNIGSESSHHAEGCLMATEPADCTRFTGKTLKRFRGVDKW